MHFYSTIIALTALTASVRALPPRRVTPRNAIGNVMTGTGGLSPGGSINDANTNCTGLLGLPVGCGSIVNIASSKGGTHPSIPQSNSLSRQRRSRRGGKLRFGSRPEGWVKKVSHVKVQGHQGRPRRKCDHRNGWISTRWLSQWCLKRPHQSWLK
jgi:hypothetical protein